MAKKLCSPPLQGGVIDGGSQEATGQEVAVRFADPPWDEEHSRWRELDRVGPLLARWNQQIVELVVERGISQGEQVALDGSTVASAGEDRRQHGRSRGGVGTAQVARFPAVVQPAIRV